MAEVKGYSATQIALHWIVALLIAAQFLLNDAIGSAFRAAMRGEEVGFNPLVAAHVFGGIAILVLVLWRIVLRKTRGAPLPPAEEAPPLQLLAKLTHGGLYLLMIVLVPTGGAAWFLGNRGAAEVHEVLTSLLLVLVGLHVIGALYHQFVLKTNLMERMKRPAA